jgi:hypothetical protein
VVSCGNGTAVVSDDAGGEDVWSSWNRWSDG